MNPDEEVIGWNKKVVMAKEIIGKSFSSDEGDLIVASIMLAIGIDISREIQIAKEE